MKSLKAYHGSEAVKQKYVDRMKEHRRLEQLTQGLGWSYAETKGCAVGCTLDKYDHLLYPIELGLPEWLAKLEDHIFEKLPKKDAEEFAEQFLTCIPVGAYVEPVRHKLTILRQEAALARIANNKEPYADECRNAIGLVIEWHKSQLVCELRGNKRLAAESAARSAARSAAESAAESAARSAAESAAESAARSAAWAAAWAAESAAESAAWSAESAAWAAAWAARSAAWSAESAAWSAESDYYQWEAKTLLELLSNSDKN